MHCKIAVVIPCYGVKSQILNVLSRIGGEVDFIFVVDDHCPEHTGAWVRSNCKDERVTVLEHAANQGVGGAVMTGYAAALAQGADVLVKVDGDGQMDPSLIPRFVAPLLKGQADYVKGNRFYDLTRIGRMPTMRLIGNAALSFAAKFSTGYWNLFDVNNGFTALHAKVAELIPFDKVNRRYFFETDMLFRLNTLRAVVVDVPMHSVYDTETSNLKVSGVAAEFLVRHIQNFFKRIFYSYFLRDMTAASLELVIGSLMLVFGVGFGISHWMSSLESGILTPTGTIMLAALPTLAGIQMLLAFISFDVANVPRRPIHPDFE